MITLSPTNIIAKERDFHLFEANETLGENIKPAFKAFIYGCANDAFGEAWTRGLKWGWAQANLDLNSRANERMRHAFDFVYPTGLPSGVAPPSPDNGIPREDSLDLQWFRSVIGHISLAHLKVYGALHNLQNKPTQEKFTNIVRFYQGVMAIAWRAGWVGGEDHAKEQYRQRDISHGLYEQVDRQALSMEQDHLHGRMDTMFEVTEDDIAHIERRLDERMAQIRPRP